MRLSEKEYYKYLEIHPKLIYHVGKKKNLIPAKMSLEEFLALSVQEKFPIRESLYDNIHLIDDYVEEYSKNLSEEDIQIIQGFKHFKRGTFYVMNLTKKHALFMDEDYAYAVWALNDPFQSFFGNHLPVMVHAVLLPFKGKIIYDGMISNYPMRFGRSITSSLKNAFNLAKGKYGIITQLPIGEEIEGRSIDLEKTLAIMMKTKASREQNWYEIETLLEENPRLIPFYNRECGRINVRSKKKALKELTIKNRYFAMHVDLIIASGKNQAEAKNRVEEMISDKDVLNSIYYFKV